MSASHWGHCQHCKMWQIEPDAAIAADTMGLCVAEDLLEYKLRVSGDSGCTIFKKGEILRAKGSSDSPPTASKAK